MAQSETPARRKPRFRERKAASAASPAAPSGAPRPDTPAAGTPRVSGGVPAAGYPTAAAPAERASARALAAPRVAALTLTFPRVTTEHALYGSLLVAAFLLRFWDVGSRAMHGDEAIHAWFSWHVYNGTGYQYDPVYHGPLQFLVTAAFYFLFGVSDTTARLMAVLFGSGLVVLPFFLRRWMGRPAALIASLFLAFSPAFVYVSRLERDDIFTSAFALILAISLFAFVRSRQMRYVYIGAATIALSLAAMENTYITLFVLGSYTIVVMASEYVARRPTSGGYPNHLAALWRRTGTEDRISAPALLGAAALLLLAGALTVTRGLYPPVPLVLGLGIVALVNRQTVLHVVDSGETPFLTAFRSITPAVWFNALSIVVAILFLSFSTFGTNLRGIWDASQPFFNTAHACPGNPFPLNPCRKDIIGGLFYWLSQHQVHRGGQPWFYYSLLAGLYEQIAVLFGAAGILWFVRRPTAFTSFLIYWAILMFGVYSWAGEKFPWLIIHPLMPFVLLAAMVVVAVARHPHAGTRPSVRYPILALLALLTVLELHSTYEVNFVNGADPVEMMVYVQSSPDTPRVARDILSLSNKVTGDAGLHVTIDALETWPFAWYLRDMPNVAYPSYPELAKPPYSTNPVILVDEGNQPFVANELEKGYTFKRYRLRWWFPEDYKSLTWSSFGHDAVTPGYWRVIGQWLLQRRPFGPKDAVWFYYYVKKGLASPY